MRWLHLTFSMFNKVKVLPLRICIQHTAHLNSSLFCIAKMCQENEKSHTVLPVTVGFLQLTKRATESRFTGRGESLLLLLPTTVTAKVIITGNNNKNILLLSVTVTKNVTVIVISYNWVTVTSHHYLQVRQRWIDKLWWWCENLCCTSMEANLLDSRNKILVGCKLHEKEWFFLT